MHKLTLDFTPLKNEITKIHNKAFSAVESKDNNYRRDALLKVVEQLKALKSDLDTGNVTLEVK